jgi:hypothetical protein
MRNRIEEHINLEMVEAAARAQWEHSPQHSSWSSLNISVKANYCDRVEAGLNAVREYLLSDDPA